MTAPAPTDPDVIAWQALMEAHERVLTGIRAALEPHGLSVSEFDVLAHLAPRESCRHADLASRVILSRTALTRLVDRLVARGLVTRQPDAHDGRGVLVTLTPQGRRLRGAALAANHRAVTAAMQSLTGEDVAVLDRLVRRLGR